MATVSVHGAEYSDFDSLFSGPPKHDECGGAKEIVEQGSFVVKEGPQQMGYGKGDVLVSVK
ncbi:hypothetical protein ACIQCT_23860 [Enterobacter cancerogenus]|uniref:hypothetical protein n=1 Tax=Enterobacter cancerogenus TaxID=69218 RepID=UPI003818D663